MKIVTYNVNGLRQRVSQHGSLLKLLNSLDADIICFQETKLQRHDLTVDVTMAEGYEAFLSCTRTSSKGRLGYSDKPINSSIDRRGGYLILPRLLAFQLSLHQYELVSSDGGKTIL